MVKLKAIFHSGRLLLGIGCCLLVGCEVSHLDMTPVQREAVRLPSFNGWTHYAECEGGLLFLTDRCLVLNAEYTSFPQLPTGPISGDLVKRILNAKTSHEFALSDLMQQGTNGDYRSSKGIWLGRAYVQFLTELSERFPLRLRGAEVADPVLILADDRVIGAVMPLSD